MTPLQKYNKKQIINIVYIKHNLRLLHKYDCEFASVGIYKYLLREYQISMIPNWFEK